MLVQRDNLRALFRGRCSISCVLDSLNRRDCSRIQTSVFNVPHRLNLIFLVVRATSTGCNGAAAPMMDVVVVTFVSLRAGCEAHSRHGILTFHHYHFIGRNFHLFSLLLTTV